MEVMYTHINDIIKEKKMSTILDMFKALNSGMIPGTSEYVDLEELRSDEVREELIKVCEKAGLKMGVAMVSTVDKTVSEKVFMGLKEWRRAKAEGFGLPEEAILEDVILKEISRDEIGKREDLLAHGLLTEGKYEIFGSEIYEVVANLT